MSILHFFKKRSPALIHLDEAEIRMGVTLELEAKAAQARLQALVESAQMFRGQIFAKYRVDESKYLLNDWLTGFEAREE